MWQKVPQLTPWWRTQLTTAEVVGAEVVGEGVEQGVVCASEEVEGEGDACKDVRDRTTDVDKLVEGVEGTRREVIVQMTREDETLKKVRWLGDQEKNGYLWEDGLLFRHT